MLWNTKIQPIYNEIKNKEENAVPKTELEIEPIGEPDINALPESEQLTFFETLLARIKELTANSEKQY